MTFKTDKLAPADFATMLRHGRGLALMQVLEHGLNGIEEIVLQACLSDQAYDPQCESTRAPWLYQMFKGSPQHAHFSAEILSALNRTTAHWDLVQLCELVAEMAIDGDAAAAAALRDFVLSQQFADDSDQFGCDALVKLDGMPALAELGRRFGAMLLADPTAFIKAPGDLMDGFEDKPANLAALEQLALHDAALGAYLARYRRDLAARMPVSTLEQQRAATRARIRKEYSIDTILSAAAAGKGGAPGFYRAFGMHATSEELEAVLQQLMVAPSPPVCQRLLWVFHRAHMPRIAARVWELAEHRDEELRDAANRALSGVSDPAIGLFARRKLRDNPRADLSILELFTRNYVAGDTELILAHLANATLADEAVHAVTCDLVDICEANLSPSIAPLAEWTYKNTPCSVCRKQAIECLIAVSGLPPAWANECRSDANQRIRALHGSCNSRNKPRATRIRPPE